MSATPGACIKPCLVRRPLCHKVNLPRCEANLSNCVARRPLCHKVNLPSCVVRQPLCHKVNLPRCEARRRHLIMTCDIFGMGQTNTLTLCYLLGKTYKPAHSSVTDSPTLESLKSTRSTKLLEKILMWAAHTFYATAPCNRASKTKCSIYTPDALWPMSPPITSTWPRTIRYLFKTFLLWYIF